MATDDRSDVLPPASCPRLLERPRELRHLLCLLLFLLLLTAAIAGIIWLSGWVDGEYEMTSVTSTRELRPVPKLLTQVKKDPSTLPVIYHEPSQPLPYSDNEEGLPTSPNFRSVMLLVVVDSPADNSDMRRAVRETWQRYPSVGVSARVVFSVAAKGLAAGKLNELVEESRRFNDVVVFPESKVLPESEHLLYQLFWAEQAVDYQYLLKTKDRFYVRLEELLHELRQERENTNIYWGYFEGNRWAQQRWSGKHPEPDWFLCNKFIRFAQSGGYVVSRALIQRLLRAADYLHLYQNEDVSLATWLAPFADVVWKHDVRFDTDVGLSRGCQNHYIIFPVNSRADMLQRHERLSSSGRVCRKEHRLLQPHSYDFSVMPAQCCSAL